MLKFISFSKATRKNQIHYIKDNIMNLVEEVYNDVPHLFPVPLIDRHHDEDDLENLIWMFIKRNSIRKKQ